MSKSTHTARLRLRVSPAAETKLRAGHPWIFSDSIRDQNRDGHTGELAVIYDRKDAFLAVGLFDPDSPLRVRVLHAGKPQTIDAVWWRTRLSQALERRKGLFDERTNGYRWINGESDGWPGLVLDRYDTTLVLKLYSAGWLPRLKDIVDWIGGVSPALCRQEPVFELVLRLSRNIQDSARDRFNLADGQWLLGERRNARPAFLENGLRFEADVVRGQKTGFFLDQRENRRAVESLAQDRDVLNAFSFTGGFSVYAARGGARSVTDLDISRHALAGSERNFALNRHVSRVVSCRHEMIHADAFEWIEQVPKRRFYFVILDPPSLAKRESERPRAMMAYGRLASAGIRLLKPRGIL